MANSDPKTSGLTTIVFFSDPIITKDSKQTFRNDRLIDQHDMRVSECDGVNDCFVQSGERKA